VPRAKHAGLATLLLDHHAEIDASCLELMGAAFVDDPPTLARRWRVFEHQLLDHMAAEEELLIPTYQLTSPEQAQELRADHILLRDILERVALDVELHTIRIERLKELVGLLRAHAHREELTMYPWIQRHLSTVLRKRLVSRISETLRNRRAWDELHST
jgi:hemerythrin superfamily protein